jgi:hypothetical protein
MTIAASRLTTTTVEQPPPAPYVYAYVGNDPINLIDPSGLLANQVSSAAYGLLQSHPVTTGYAVTGLGIAATVGAEVLSGGADTPAVPAEIAGAVEAGAATTAALQATQLADALGNTSRFVTIGVTETAEGTTVISSSENALRPILGPPHDLFETAR